ncbi:hypothetical protein ABZ863_01155 [Saccharomonospora sp. NPDC046836]|uniref:hypothetical protein n=1 Tax=Saccharomonospora sp. NPDC046836 TaxID=3156921 RepID=UPI0033DEF038
MSDVVWPAVPGYSNKPLHQPWRVLVAVAECLVAALSVWGALACWAASQTTVSVRLDDGTQLVSYIYAGNWVGLAIGLAGLAGILVLDAVRQFSLGVRTRRRKYRKSRENGQAAAA